MNRRPSLWIEHRMPVFSEIDYELKNRYMHIDYADFNSPQSVKPKVPKSQFDTLDCTLEERTFLELIQKIRLSNNRNWLSTGKSLSTVEIMIKSLQKNSISAEKVVKDTANGKYWFGFK